MNDSRPSILIIGALPPPAIGPSIAMQRLVQSPALQQQFNVSFLDISDHRSPINIGKLDLMNFLLGLRQSAQCLARLLWRKPQLVYLGISQGTWGYLRDLAFVVPALLLRKRLILHLRGSEFRTFYEQTPAWLRWVTRKVLAHTSRVIVLGQSLKNIFDGLIDSSRIVVIPNGIDYQQYTLPKDQPASGQRLLYLSSLKRRKGIFLLLEALPRVFSRFPHAEITFAGRWQDYGEQAAAEHLLGKMGFEKNVRFVGEVTGSAKVRLFHDHNVFVFTPIEPEGLPWVILEAMSAGLPVVTTNQGAISEVVVNSSTGFIVQPTPKRVANAICELLADPVAARDMGSRGRRRVEEHFSEQIYLSRLISAFHSAATENSTQQRGLVGRLEQTIHQA